MEAYVNDWCKAARFLDDKEKQRPPVYTFAWGTATPYLEYCFVEKLSYKLTKFLPDGTPVRAVIDSLVLKQTNRLKTILNCPQRNLILQKTTRKLAKTSRPKTYGC